MFGALGLAYVLGVLRDPQEVKTKAFRKRLYVMCQSHPWHLPALRSAAAHRRGLSCGGFETITRQVQIYNYFYNFEQFFREKLTKSLFFVKKRYIMDI